MAATKRLLKERASLERDPVPYVTFHNDDDDDEEMADSGTNGIFEWRIVLTLDPSHDSLDDATTIGKAADSPYCVPPPSAAGSAAPEKKSGGILAGVTRAAKAKSAAAATSAADAGASAPPSPIPAYFAFKFVFPPNYPFKAPTITVLSSTYHPNINSKTGEICDAVLTGEEWGPTLNVRKVCARLRKFLCEPDPDHPLESTIAQTLVETPEEYKKKAFECAGEHATKTKAFQDVARGTK